jgi:hypothetical protein
MTWGWDARGALPADGTATGTAGGGQVGTLTEASKTQAWPRYEAEYLKRALVSERNKYDASGLDEQEKAVYLDRVVGNYRDEADECLKAEFEQWLQGNHEANDPATEQMYENADGKPVRRWVFRSKESEDADGGYKVGQARAGWKHTPWGRAGLTHLPGVREYLHKDKQSAHDKDFQMQLLAEMGPQNIDQSWAYFKHWVKGRPLSDAVAIPAHFEEGTGSRSDMGRQMPHRMHAYDPVPNDRQPGVYASDPHAHNAAVQRPGSPPPRFTTEWEDRNVEEARNIRTRLQDLLSLRDQKDLPSEETRARDDAADVRDVAEGEREKQRALAEKHTQDWRQAELTVPGSKLLPSL